MAILKCKMCGGDIELSADKTFGTCEFCGSTMTFPKVDDEQRAAAFNRGNHFRRIGEFDKALAVYERIVQEDENDAEAHWCCALCRFGIEYVEDPNTLEYLPTCHRASFDSFLEDVDYLAALEHSDGITRRQYQKDAAKIAEVQRGILATSQNEEPFDVFICYKESENDGSRTRDSLYAQDIYYQLTEQGRRVFFSRITLEDKAGTEYEPYIFAALNSAKVMILVTTSAEHANAVWVKNEWSRFLSLMRKDRSKLLLPCYRDMDPYDLPEALSVLQSYDMSKIGFIQDLTRGINKVLDGAKPKQTAKETVVIQQQSGYAAPLLERAFMFLEDGDWAKADDFCEQVLNLEPKNALAYLGKLMAELKVRKREQLKDQSLPFDDRNNYQKALRFADGNFKAELSSIISFINERNETARKEDIYQQALAAIDRGEVADYREAARLFETISDYKDSAQKAQECREQAVILPKENAYRTAIALMANGYENDFRHAAEQFRRLSGYKDADAKVQECLEKAEIARKENIYTTCKQVLARRQTPQGNWAEAIGTFYVPSKGEAYERWFNSIKGFESIADYKDSSELAEQCREKLYALLTNELETATDVETLTGVSESFVKMGDYKEAREKAQACLEKRENCRKQLLYSDAVKTMNGAGVDVNKLELAIRKFASVAGWQNADELVETCRRRIEQIKAQEEVARLEAERKAEAERLEAERKAEAESRSEKKKKKRLRAIIILLVIIVVSAAFALNHWNTVVKPQQVYDQAVAQYNSGMYEEAITLFSSIEDYKDSAEKAKNAYIEKCGLQRAQVGDTILFGLYEQDNDISNGKENIEWLVLKKENDCILVISKYALDSCIFSDPNNGSWENSRIKEWLNKELLTNAFSLVEQNMIPYSRSNDIGVHLYSLTKTYNSGDKVFLLSVPEAKDYFQTDNNRQCQGSPYCYAQGASKSESGKCEWWLQSNGSTIGSHYWANHVGFDGSISLVTVNRRNVAVRPALWINYGTN